MHYTENANSCRVDFFKESGKWYATQAVIFSDDDYDSDPRDALRKALARRASPKQFSGMTAVCSEPYVRNAFPVLIVV